MKSVAIVQSNYIPWRGYFDLISSVDEFILLDDVQYTKQDWRNRNRIKTEHGVVWLTIPVRGALHKRIDQVEVADPDWAGRHLEILARAYRSAPCLEQCLPWLDRALPAGEQLAPERGEPRTPGGDLRRVGGGDAAGAVEDLWGERHQEPEAARALPRRGGGRVRLGPGCPQLPGRERVPAGRDRGALVRLPRLPGLPPAPPSRSSPGSASSTCSFSVGADAPRFLRGRAEPVAQAAITE